MSITWSSDPALGYAALTAVGRVRRHNEDALLCCPQLRLWAVADGMGGHRCGEVASALALDVLRRQIARGEGLHSAVLTANAAVLAAAEAEEGRRGMGTTLVAVRFSGADFQLAWAGDSRAYRIGTGAIEQLTHDHSWVQAMVDAGRLSAEEASRHPLRNVLTRCLGQSGEALEVALAQGRLGHGELLLLCSDGLTRELGDAQILQLCAGAATLDALVGALVEAANRMGGSDNITCIALGLASPPPVQAAAQKPRSFLDKLLKPAKN
ncbi:protein phosphatase [Azotobacter beijerinckii]|uniref:Protein phosphatase n=1 Tax=Azotobacter beijerinckii TaxID=170623 RepID=A0A1H6R3Z6_9GAMM|nr:PP2C family serine/threonine-protein phosphatase [Azotobacter beijerinckii]SEI46510.1 protein phosphatase [Azotobacter beijerinckii]